MDEEKKSSLLGKKRTAGKIGLGGGEEGEAWIRLHFVSGSSGWQKKEACLKEGRNSRDEMEVGGGIRLETR